MKCFRSSQRGAFLMLLILLLNPLISLAGSLGLEADVPASALETNDHAKCHDAASELPPTELSKCCNDACFCAQGACGAHIALLNLIYVDIDSASFPVEWRASRYADPLAAAQNPPPIASFS